MAQLICAKWLHCDAKTVIFFLYFAHFSQVTETLLDHAETHSLYNGNG